jgi:hypothetical protein
MLHAPSPIEHISSPEPKKNSRPSISKNSWMLALSENQSPPMPLLSSISKRRMEVSDPYSTIRKLMLLQLKTPFLYHISTLSLKEHRIKPSFQS